jgi:hypothetical protein
VTVDAIEIARHNGELAILLGDANARIDRLEAALRFVTDVDDCGHGHREVRHVAPIHFDGPACRECSDAAYADEMQRVNPCPLCAALAEAPR